MKTNLTRELMLEIRDRIKKSVAMEYPNEEVESIEIDFEGDIQATCLYSGDVLIFSPNEI